MCIFLSQHIASANSTSQPMGETELLICNLRLLCALSSHKRTRSLPPLPHLPPLCWSPNRAGPPSVSVPGPPFPPASSQLKLALPSPCCWDLPAPQTLGSKCETHFSANTFPVRPSDSGNALNHLLLPGGARVGACLGQIWPSLHRAASQPGLKPSPDAVFPHHVPMFLWHLQGSWVPQGCPHTLL